MIMRPARDGDAGIWLLLLLLLLHFARHLPQSPCSSARWPGSEG